MNKKKMLQQLYENRLLNSDEKYVLFEEALESIASNVQLEDIPELCVVLDDNTEDDEMMYGIIHLMESLRGMEYLRLIIINTIKMKDHAFEWAKTLNKRILNSEEYRKKYSLVLKDMDNESIEEISILLKEIEKDNPNRFKEKVDDVIQAIKNK